MVGRLSVLGKAEYIPSVRNPYGTIRKSCKAVSALQHSNGFIWYDTVSYCTRRFRNAVTLHAHFEAQVAMASPSPPWQFLCLVSGGRPLTTNGLSIRLEPDDAVIRETLLFGVELEKQKRTSPWVFVRFG